MREVDEIVEWRGCDQDEEVTGFWAMKIDKFFNDLQDNGNTNLKETIIIRKVTGIIMKSSTEVFDKFSVSAQLSAKIK